MKEKGVISDLSIEEDNMQGSPVLILECDNVKTTISNIESDFNDQEYSVPNLMKENPAVKITWNEENRVMDPKVLMSSEHNLHEEVIQSTHEHQDGIFAQASEKVPLDEFMVDDRYVIVRFQETSEFAFLMINECDECNENLAHIV